MLTNKIILTDHEGNELRMSSVNEFNDDVYFKQFSVKYVVTGEERYSINQKKINVSNGEFVVGNQHSFSSILIDSSFPVKGICVDITKQKIQEIVQFNYHDTEEFEKFLFSDELLNKKYTKQNSSLGYIFEKLENQFTSIVDTPELLNNELFYSIAEGIVNDQGIVFQNYSKLNFCKQETNKRLFEFVNSAKDFIDVNFHQKITIDQLSKEANLSEYHFIRLFKQLFQLTPHQYIIQKRLEFSKLLLLENYSISEVAFQSGFNDVYSFSKSFKSKYGFTPNFYKNSK